MSTWFISPMVAEEMFNRVKSDVGGSSNTRCTPQRTMAICIDTGVLNKLNKYNEVERESETIERAFTFDEHTFMPQMNLNKLGCDETRKANFKRIVGIGDAPWFAPTACNSSSPYADILACRDLGVSRLRRLETVWFARLAHQRVLIRKVGQDDWNIVIGELHSTIVRVWPAVCRDGQTYKPRVDEHSESVTITITNPDVWEGLPFEPVGRWARPLHAKKAHTAQDSATPWC